VPSGSECGGAFRPVSAGIRRIGESVIGLRAEPDSESVSGHLRNFHLRFSFSGRKPRAGITAAG